MPGPSSGCALRPHPRSRRGVGLRPVRGVRAEGGGNAPSGAGSWGSEGLGDLGDLRIRGVEGLGFWGLGGWDRVPRTDPRTWARSLGVPSDSLWGRNESSLNQRREGDFGPAGEETWERGLRECAGGTDWRFGPPTRHAAPFAASRASCANRLEGLHCMELAGCHLQGGRGLPPSRPSRFMGARMPTAVPCNVEVLLMPPRQAVPSAGALPVTLKAQEESTQGPLPGPDIGTLSPAEGERVGGEDPDWQTGA